MNCLHCGKNLIQVKGKMKKVFCGDTCRKAYNRKVKSGQATADKLTADISTTDTLVSTEDKQPEQIIPDKIKNLSRLDLKLAIDSYPEDTWKDSPEFAELEHRLRTKSEKELRAEGYSIPSQFFPNKIVKKQ